MAHNGRMVFHGQKFSVFAWQHRVLEQMLAPHGAAFDLQACYRLLDAECLTRGWLVPQFHDMSRWLYEQTRDEALRRGYEMAETDKERFSPFTLRLRAAYRRVVQAPHKKLPES